MTSALTFDVDWAPDWATEIVCSICRRARVPATIFATHASPLMDRLRAEPLFELGIHPNFLPGSTHGGDEEAVLEHCLAMVPMARSMRTHSLYQSSRLFETVTARFPAIALDCSLFLPAATGLAPVVTHYGGRPLLRLPYYFEDDVFAERPGWTWADAPPPAHGLRIFDFHPILVALNVDTLDRYQALKRAMADKPIAAWTEADVTPFVNHGHGARDFLGRLAWQLAGDDICPLTSIDTDDTHSSSTR